MKPDFEPVTYTPWGEGNLIKYSIVYAIQIPSSPFPFYLVFCSLQYHHPFLLSLSPSHYIPHGWYHLQGQAYASHRCSPFPPIHLV